MLPAMEPFCVCKNFCLWELILGSLNQQASKSTELPRILPDRQIRWVHGDNFLYSFIKTYVQSSSRTVSTHSPHERSIPANSHSLGVSLTLFEIEYDLTPDFSK